MPRSTWSTTISLANNKPSPPQSPVFTTGQFEPRFLPNRRYRRTFRVVARVQFHSRNRAGRTSPSHHQLQPTTYHLPPYNTRPPHPQPSQISCRIAIASLLVLFSTWNYRYCAGCRPHHNQPHRSLMQPSPWPPAA